MIDLTVCAVDPGLATGAAVLFGTLPQRVLDAVNLKTPKAQANRDRPGDMQFTDAVLRARGQAAALRAFLIEHNPDMVCVESFVDLASRRRKGEGGKEDRLRWQTPLVIGMIDPMLRELGYQDHQIRYQNPVALHHFRVERGVLWDAIRTRRKRTEHLVLPGDELITNEHLLSAFTHGLWTLDRMDAQLRQPDPS